MRYAQLVMGPAGSGKSRYCSTIQKHCESVKRTVSVINLDPAAEVFDYKAQADIRELIHLDDAMEDEDMHFGPNGGLIFCMEFLLENLSWLEEQLGDVEDDYILFDLPGQIELYTHLNVMQRFVETLQASNFRVCAVFLLDAHFMVNSSSFISGAMAALSAMVCLSVPHINIISKVDLLSSSAKKDLDRYIEPDTQALLPEEPELSDAKHPFVAWKEKHRRLTQAIGDVLEDFSLVKFYPLDIRDEENIGDLLVTIDNAIQYGEDEEVKARDFEQPDPEDDDGYVESDNAFNSWVDGALNQM